MGRTGGDGTAGTRQQPGPHAVHGGASFDVLGSDFRHLERRHEVVPADVLDAWYDPAPTVVEALGRDLAWLVKSSPPTHADGLERTISEVRGVPPENLLVGGGSSNLIYLLLPQLVRPGDRACLLDPTYGEYAHVLENVLGHRCRRTPLAREDGFRARMDVLLEDVAQSDIVVLVNPNSPTGTRLSREAVLEVLAALPRFGWLVVDETYADFAAHGGGGSTSVERDVADHANLAVVKSMSKWYALSGCRVGYLTGPAELVARLRPHAPPWPVSLVGQVAAVEALRAEAWYRERAHETHALRAGLAEELRAVPGLRVHPSCANFLLVELVGEGARSADVVRVAARHGVYLRNCDDLGRGMSGRFVRVAVRDAASNTRIVTALREALPVRFVPRLDAGPEPPDDPGEIPRGAPAAAPEAPGGDVPAPAGPDGGAAPLTAPPEASP